MAIPTILKGETASLSPSTFTRDGYFFTGWNTKSSGNGTSYADGESITPTSNLTLYAQWTNSFTVRFDGTYKTGGTMPAQTITIGTEGNLNPNNFTRDHYSFACWNTNFDGSGISFADGASFSELLATGQMITRLYAQWVRNYKVHFDSNGNAANGAMSNQEFPIGAPQTLKANAFYTDGNFIFSCWNTKSDGSGISYADGETVTDIAAPGETITLYAQWVHVATNTIYFDGNGATGGSMSNQYIRESSSANLTANAFTRMGYDFTGWNTAANGGGIGYSDGQSITPILSMTLYAQWAVNDATIELGNGSTNNGAIIADLKGQTRNVTLTGRTLFKDGKWNTLCLPFSMTAAQIAANADFAGAEIRELSSASFDDGTLTLDFTPATGEGAVTGITAGVPCIIRWESGSSFTPTFSGVTIDATARNKACDLGGGKSITFTGTYNPVRYADENKSVLFLGEGNTLYYPDGKATTTIGACRAYFALSGLTAGEPSDPNATGVRAFNLNFGEGEQTGIHEITDPTPDPSPAWEGSGCAWYTLDGRKLSGKPTKSGMYVSGGRKIVVK